MTAKELAATLSGREYGMEIGPGEERKAQVDGLVVVYGYSDDNVELRGAIDEEVDAFNGTTIHITRHGLFYEPGCGIVDCPYCAVARKEAKTIKAVWHDEGGPCWTFETDIPHETFNVMEDGEVFCVGIVFSMADIGGHDEAD